MDPFSDSPHRNIFPQCNIRGVPTKGVPFRSYTVTKYSISNTIELRDGAVQ